MDPQGSTRALLWGFGVLGQWNVLWLSARK